MDNNFKYSSIRAKKARFSKIFKSDFSRAFLLVISLILLVAGLSMLLFLQNVQWFRCFRS